MTAKIEILIAELETAMEQATAPIPEDLVGRLMHLIDDYERRVGALPESLRERADRLADQSAEDMFDNMPV